MLIPLIHRCRSQFKLGGYLKQQSGEICNTMWSDRIKLRSFSSLGQPPVLMHMLTYAMSFGRICKYLLGGNITLGYKWEYNNFKCNSNLVLVDCIQILYPHVFLLLTCLLLSNGLSTWGVFFLSFLRSIQYNNKF